MEKVLNLKWLDTGSGIGSFFVIVFFKLMKHLPITNEEKKENIYLRICYIL